MTAFWCDTMATWQRHSIALIILGLLVLIFTMGRFDLPDAHLWNRAFADAAFVLLCVTLAIGPAARWITGLAALLPLRRELGVWLTVAAAIHVGIYWGSALGWNFFGFFADLAHHPPVLLRNAFGVANWVGLLAWLYLAVLALTSNDASMRTLGRGWKFLQQQSYTLLVLAVIHAAALIYLVIDQGHGIFPPVFWAAAATSAVLQIAGFVRTVIVRRRQPLSR